MPRMLLVGYLFGVRSERRLVEKVRLTDHSCQRERVTTHVVLAALEIGFGVRPLMRHRGA